MSLLSESVIENSDRVELRNATLIDDALRNFFVGSNEFVLMWNIAFR